MRAFVSREPPKNEDVLCPMGGWAVGGGGGFVRSWGGVGWLGGERAHVDV